MGKKLPLFFFNAPAPKVFFHFYEGVFKTFFPPLGAGFFVGGSHLPKRASPAPSRRGLKKQGLKPAVQLAWFYLELI